MEYDFSCVWVHLEKIYTGASLETFNAVLCVSIAAIKFCDPSIIGWLRYQPHGAGESRKEK
jgi:hypothetical protein